MRKSTWTVLAVGCAIAASTLLAPHTAGATPDERDAPAALAIEALTTTDPIAAAARIPADFEQDFGYRPLVRDGMLVNPHGTCSSPVPLPAEFDTACMGHDLGYDLLRYADRAGAPVGAWARLSLDRQLDDRLHAACAARPDDVTRASCRAVATVAATAVNSNSWRQNYAAPHPEPIGLSAALLGTAALGGAVALRRRSGSNGTAAPVVTA
ncbi:hypothetical protein ACWDUM_13415 [Rhodococcus sp. NPDC003322]